MISIIFAIFFILGLEVFLLGLAVFPRTKNWFSIIPVIFWLYFLPSVFAKFGILHIPETLASFASSWLLPLALILMIAPANVGQLMKMGKTSFVTLCAVYFTVLTGGLISFLIFRSTLAADAWEAFAALGATWTGGTVNMLAVKEIVNLSDSHFSVLILTDAFISYGWMAILMLAFRWSKHLDQWTASEASQQKSDESSRGLPWFHFYDAVWVLAAVLLVWGSRSLASFMPATETFPIKAWVLLWASVLALLAASAGWHKLLCSRFSREFGLWLLYFVLIAIRANADFSIGIKDFMIMAAALVWILIHGALMLVYAKVFRVRFAMVATASQAAIGGVISAPVVAALYDPTLISAAVLMGIFGNLVGTYLGLLLGHIIRLL